VLAEGPDGIARVRVVEGVDADAARLAIARELALLDGQYDTRLPPYPEFATREAGCAEAFRPAPVEVADGRAARLWADADLAYGDCTDEGRAHRALYAVLHCAEAARLVRIEVFVPPDRADRLDAVARAVRCAR
jgi:hypothetical protein